MSSQQHLSPPGTSVYSSNTLHVGDGTWDSSRDDFLLPNIQGLNFATMRYNGMGNRFQSLAEYHSLITAHGTIAAITFLAIVPAAILIAKFYHRQTSMALQLHISLQVITVIAATVVLMLGYFAVGPQRSLSNPHHGIGVAIYVLVVVQALGGWLIHLIEKRKMRYFVPIKLMLHQWLGRATSLLAMAQIPIGLTLYGSPLILFILYAIYMSVLVITYFILTYRANKRVAEYYDERGSYLSESQSDPADYSSLNNRHSRLKQLGGFTAGAAGIAALRRRRSLLKHGKSQSNTSMLSVESKVHGSDTSHLNEKALRPEPAQDSTWKTYLLDGAAGIGAIFGFRRSFGSKRRAGLAQEVTHWRPPHDDVKTQSTLNMDRMEAGLPLQAADTGSQPMDIYSDFPQTPLSRPVVASRLSEESHRSWELPNAQRKTIFRRGLAPLTSFGAFGAYIKRKREQKRKHEYSSGHYSNRRDAMSSNQSPGRALTSFEGPALGAVHSEVVRPEVVLDDSNAGPGHHPSSWLASNHQGRSETASASFLQTMRQTSTSPRERPSTFGLAPPPNVFHGFSTSADENMPPPPPAHQDHIKMVTPQESYLSQSRERKGTRTPTRASLSESPRSQINASPTAQASRTLEQRPLVAASGYNRGSNENQHADVESPPISVKVKMHSDGRHVTLRRLGETEAALEREARMVGTKAVRRGSSIPLESGHIDAVESKMSPSEIHSITSSLRQSQVHIPASRTSLSNMNRATRGGSAIAGSHDTSVQSESYESSRRRRRAERAKAQARQVGSGELTNKVEFT